ncbi:MULTISPECIES: DMT family transporter [Ramlibacter]|uniref:DMT family transporter n=1 Tax=Ramlibacter aquaticus TaxID=2780094 RepID=A0ABR9SE90_9BURK|nr:MULTISPECIES: DMT family transporter [Ramlibacter]MBE7940660.1 DMT family transporter [Ramlibacter aquaticus]
MTPADALRLPLLTALTMLAFAANSLLCRLALRSTGIDAASFTAVRLASGAVVLWLLARSAAPAPGAPRQGSWTSGAALFAYADAFSFAYTRLPAGVGALLLFGTVQLTMFCGALLAREPVRAPQLGGVLLALAGLAMLVRVADTQGQAPPVAVLLMMAAGVAWGVYSLRGRRATLPLLATRDNFLRAAPMALALLLPFAAGLRADVPGLALAVASGAIASGLGYALWYSVTPRLRSSSAAAVQLSVPVIAAVGGVLLLGESLSPQQWLAAAVVLAGIALAIRKPRPAA